MKKPIIIHATFQIALKKDGYNDKNLSMELRGDIEDIVREMLKNNKYWDAIDESNSNITTIIL